MDESESTPPAAGAAARAQGEELIKSGQYSEAERVLGQATAEDPGDIAAWRLLGAARASRGNHAGAVEAFEKTVALKPDSPRNRYNLAVALQGAGRVDEARRQLEQAVTLDPAYDQAKALLSSLKPHERTPRPSSSVAPAPPPAAVATPAPSPPPSSDGGLAPLGGSDLTPVGGGLSAVGGGDLAPVGGGAVAPSFASPAAATPVQGGMGAPQLRPDAPAANPYAGAYGDLPAGVQGDRIRYQNTSGMQGDVPDGAKGGFNLGAAVLSFLWLYNHNLKGFAVGIFLLNFFSRWVGGTLGIIIAVAQLGVFFTLGFMGNRLAWQYRQFDSLDDFKACQRIWMFWALPFFVLAIIGFWALFTVGPNEGLSGGAGQRGVPPGGFGGR